MKVTIFFALFALALCHHSNAQTTNNTSATLTRAHRAAVDVKHIPLSIDYGLGHVLMSEQPTLYSVQLPIGGGSSFKKLTPPDATGFGLQVWLLKTDGTVIPQSGKPGQIEIGNAGWDNYYMFYTFDKGSSNELAGIVVRVKGKLYSQEIGAERR